MLKVEAVAAKMGAEQLIEQEDVIVRPLFLCDPARSGQIPDGRGIAEKPQRALRVAQIGEGVELPSRDAERRNKPFQLLANLPHMAVGGARLRQESRGTFHEQQIRVEALFLKC